MSKFLKEKELFQKTFGGTTFNHFIEWCKKMHSSCEHTQINSITRPDRIFFIRMNKIVIALTINTIENYMDLDECFDNRCREHGCDKATIEKCYSYMRFNPAVEAPRHYIRKTLKKIEELKQKRQEIWNETYVKFKGIDTDIFTSIYEYEMPYDGSFLFNGDDSRRIKFISKIVKHINFINNLNYWVVDPESIKLQILRFDEVSIASPVKYLNKRVF